MTDGLARFVVHAPGVASRVHLIEDREPRIVGRAPPADLVIDHPSVSRRHAEMRFDAKGWSLVDLDSKNGIRVDGERVAQMRLTARRWLSVGDVFCEFEPLAAGDLQRLREQERTRRHSSAAWQARVGASRDIGDLLDNVLAGMVAVAECRRGFLLLGDGGSPPRLAARSVEPVDGGDADASNWSRTAVERAMRERRAVLLSNTSDRVWLKGAPSVVAQGLRAIACVPLLHHGELLGAIYVDTDAHAKDFSELDLELMLAFAARAAAALALASIEKAVRAIEIRAVALFADPEEAHR